MRHPSWRRGGCFSTRRAADFLRDFRGDTVHPSTQLVLQQLGLIDEFEHIVHGRMHAIDFGTTDGPLVHQDIASVQRAHPFHDIALAPQWDLLDLLVRQAKRYAGFTLVMEAETIAMLRDGGSVRGLRYRRAGGEHELRAVLTVDASGGATRRSDPRSDRNGSNSRSLLSPRKVTSIIS